MDDVHDEQQVSPTSPTPVPAYIPHIPPIRRTYNVDVGFPSHTFHAGSVSLDDAIAFSKASETPLQSSTSITSISSSYQPESTFVVSKPTTEIVIGGGSEHQLQVTSSTSQSPSIPLASNSIAELQAIGKEVDLDGKETASKPQKLVFCSVCRKSYQHLKSARQHSRKIHQIWTTHENEQGYPYFFNKNTNETTWERPAELMHPKFQCPTCDNKFVEHYQLAHHIKTKHEDLDADQIIKRIIEDRDAQVKAKAPHNYPLGAVPFCRTCRVYFPSIGNYQLHILAPDHPTHQPKSNVKQPASTTTPKPSKAATLPSSTSSTPSSSTKSPSKNPRRSSGASTATIKKAKLSIEEGKKIAQLFRECLAFLTPPEWTMSPDEILELSASDLQYFPLDSFLQHYQLQMDAFVKVQIEDANERIQSAQDIISKGRTNCEELRKMLSRLEAIRIVQNEGLPLSSAMLQALKDIEAATSVEL